MGRGKILAFCSFLVFSSLFFFSLRFFFFNIFKAHDSLKMTALHFACRHGHGAICRILLAHGADPDARDDKGVCPLHFAAYHGHFDCIAALCEGKANLTIQEGDRPHGATPLFRAAGHGNVDVIKLLLQHGAPVSTDPSFPVHAAASEGRLEALRLLLASGGDLHQLDDEGWSLLDCAGYEGHTECMWALLELGAKPVAHVCYLRPFLREAIEARDDDAVRLLCVGTGIGGYQKVPPTKVLAVHVSVQKGFLEVTEALMEAECPGKPWIDARLLAAAAHGDRKRIEAFVLLGADVNVSTTHNADTPLHLACSSPGDRVACVKLLLQYGAVVGKKDKKNSTPLHIAAARADLLMMKVLLEAGADPVAVDDGGESCLYKACATGSVAAVKLLLNGSEGAVGSASNGLIDLDSSFPLHFVAQNGSVVVLRAMLEAGKCNVNALNKAKETPLDCACAAEVVSNAQILLLAGGTATKSHPFLYKLLESAIDRGAVDEVHALIKGGLDVTRKKMGGSGRYALQAAVEKGNLEISELLADAGCRFDTKLGKNNKTPFMIAVDKNHIEIAKLAVKKGVGLDSEAILSWIWSCAAAGLSVAVSLCSDLGLDPNKAPFVAKSGETALHAAATAGQRDWVRDFVRVGANVNAVDGNGCTPIMVAALAGKMDVCKVLLEEGECELDHISKNGLQLIHILADAGKEDTLEIVLDLNPELVDVPNLHEETPLMLAVKKSREGAVRLLLDRRANLFARNKQGKVAATMTKNKAIKRMLADREAEIAAEEAEAEEQEEEEEDGQSEGEAEGEEEEVEEAEKDDDGGNQSEEDKIVVAEPAPHVQVRCFSFSFVMFVKKKVWGKTGIQGTAQEATQSRGSGTIDCDGSDDGASDLDS